MQPSNKEISLAFSGGNFSFAYDHLADDVCWNIPGEQVLNGKEAIIEFCIKTSKYFEQVTTVFKLESLIVEGDGVAISGTAEFVNEKENRSHHISSCDIYNFNDGKLQKITSYCIVTGKEA